MPLGEEMSEEMMQLHKRHCQEHKYKIWPQRGLCAAVKIHCLGIFLGNFLDSVLLVEALLILTDKYVCLNTDQQIDIINKQKPQ